MRAVLDTNIARTLGCPADANFGTVLAGLQALKGAGFSLHLAYFTVVELLEQVREERFSWPEWVRARDHLELLLSSTEPIMFGGTELLASIGILTPGGAIEVPLGLRENLKATWKEMATARSPRELPNAAAVRRREQSSWVEMVDGFCEEATKMARTSVKGEPITEGKYQADNEATGTDLISLNRDVVDDMLDLFYENYDKKVTVTSGPKASVRLDAMFRVDAHFFRLRMGKRPYNPKKQANDVFDCELLRYLAFPAVVCTYDGKFTRAVEESGTWQRRWVLGPAELHHLAQGGSPPDMGWPE
jgi:hypothetical protein